MKLCDHNQCTVCGACVNICPKQCISYKENIYGFLYPYIDSDLCISCGKCISVCHAINDITKNYPQNAYAVWSNDTEDRRTSTSGGAASVFYKQMLKIGGYCYGATYDNNLNVVIRGYRDERIIEFKNSKYVHSDMVESYKEIESLLYNNERVIFIGLPCQVAALKTYIKNDYDNLITVDLICHGTPPNKYLAEHIEMINSKTNKKIDTIRFRNDNEYFFNALMNVPAYVGDRILVEDKDYLLDAVISEHTGNSEKDEYYHVTDNYFPVQEVAEILALELSENGNAMVRTDYELNDNEFYEITDAVYDIMGDDIQLYGYYWLGVIYLSIE